MLQLTKRHRLIWSDTILQIAPTQSSGWRLIYASPEVASVQTSNTDWRLCEIWRGQPTENIWITSCLYDEKPHVMSFIHCHTAGPLALFDGTGQSVALLVWVCDAVVLGIMTLNQFACEYFSPHCSTVSSARCGLFLHAAWRGLSVCLLVTTMSQCRRPNQSRRRLAFGGGRECRLWHCVITDQENQCHK